MISPTKNSLLIGAIVLANCAPWLLYRQLRTPYHWPSHEPSYVWGPEHVSLDLTGVKGKIPFYFRAFQVLSLAQVLLFAVWTAFGEKPFSWRFCYLIGCVALITRMHISDPTQPAWSAAKHFLLKYFLGLAICVMLFLLLLRFLGFQFQATRPNAAPFAMDSLQRARQFTIRYALWWLVGLGFVLGLCKHLFTAEEALYWIRTWPTELGLYLSAAAMTCACIWLAFGSRHFLVRLAVFSVSVVVASCWEYNWPWFAPQFDVAYICNQLGIFLPVAIWVTGTLWVFRAIGLTLQRGTRAMNEAT